MSYETQNLRILPSYLNKDDFIRPSVYDVFCEEAEENLFEQLNFDLDCFSNVLNACFVPRHTEFDYPKPVKAGDFMDVKSIVQKVGNTSIIFHHTFYKKNSRTGEQYEVATSERVLVAVDRYDRTPRKLPPELVKSIREVRPEAFENDSVR